MISPALASSIPATPVISKSSGPSSWHSKSGCKFAEFHDDLPVMSGSVSETSRTGAGSTLAVAYMGKRTTEARSQKRESEMSEFTSSLTPES